MKLRDILEDLMPGPENVTDVMRVADDQYDKAVSDTPKSLKHDKIPPCKRGENHKEAKRIVAVSRTKARAHPYKSDKEDQSTAAIVQSTMNGWD